MREVHAREEAAEKGRGVRQAVDDRGRERQRHGCYVVHDDYGRSMTFTSDYGHQIWPAAKFSHSRGGADGAGHADI